MMKFRSNSSKLIKENQQVPSYKASIVNRFLEAAMPNANDFFDGEFLDSDDELREDGPDIEEVSASDQGIHLSHLISDIDEMSDVHPDYFPPSYEGQFEVTSAHRLLSDMGFKHMRDLLEMAELDDSSDWLVRDLLVRGGLSLLSGKPKAGKTTLVKSLILSVARGELFLGCSSTRGRVLYLALEEHQGFMARHFKKVGAQGTDNIYFSFGPPLGNPTDTLVKIVRETRPDLVVIDPIQRFICVRDDGSYAGVTTAFDPLIRMAREYKTHLLCIHHKRKAGGSEEGVLGSTAFYGSVDTLIDLEKQGDQRFVALKHRYGDDLPKTKLLYNEEAGTFSLGDQVSEGGDTGLAQQIKTLLSDRGELSQSELFKKLNGSYASKSVALQMLVEDGSLKRTGEGLRGSPYCYSLPVVDELVSPLSPGVLNENKSGEALND